LDDLVTILPIAIISTVSKALKAMPSELLFMFVYYSMRLFASRSQHTRVCIC
jgi:hypothetical protein